jgi:CRISPR-associated endonuclease/helicase Cas3
VGWAVAAVSAVACSFRPRDRDDASVSTPARILAKSRQGNLEVTLAEHTRSVVDAVAILFGSPEMPSRLALRWLQFFRLELPEFGPFLANTWLAAALHDIGKANDGFQAAVNSPGAPPQPIRHEHIGPLLISEGPVLQWLRSLIDRGADPEVVLSAVASHHLKSSPETFAAPTGTIAQQGVEVFASALDVQQVLSIAAEIFEVEPAAALGGDGWWSFDGGIGSARDRFLVALARFGRSLRFDDRRQRLLWAVKSAVIAADSAGSALVREGMAPEDWLRSCFERQPLSGRDIEQGVIAPRVVQIQARGRWVGWQEFQIGASSLGPRVLLLAGCGSGKTLAAWRWAAAQLERRPAARVMFLYPTRGTATEGFRDYASWAGDDEAALVHGTAAYELIDLFTNPEDQRTGDDFSVAARLFALGYWPRRIFSSTVDSFLAFLANTYAPLCLMPLLVDAVLILDEVHAYDRLMFRALERLLQTFDVPVLAMTASLPEDRVRILRDECGLRVFPGDGQLFADLQAQAATPRYIVRQIDRSQADRVASQATADGKRVLWVANTVPRCQAIAERLRQAGVDPLVYHSRFRLVDRKGRHAEVVEAFQQLRRGSVVATVTQVCELSLDLDTDVLISEIAPVTALIQRMGRCARSWPLNGRLGEVFFCKPSDQRPYSEAEMSQGAAFATWLAAQERVAQADLAEYLAQLDSASPFMAGGWTGFLDSGWYALGRDDTFREDDEITVDAILPSDRDAYLEARRTRSAQAQGYIVPVLRRHATADSSLDRWVQVASGGTYSEALGFVGAT